MGGGKEERKKGKNLRCSHTQKKKRKKERRGHLFSLSPFSNIFRLSFQKEGRKRKEREGSAIRGGGKGRKMATSSPIHHIAASTKERKEKRKIARLIAA